jgi:hypothetical protein
VRRHAIILVDMGKDNVNIFVMVQTALTLKTKDQNTFVDIEVTD